MMNCQIFGQLAAIAVALAAAPTATAARQGDMPPCDPVILGASKVIFDFSMGDNAAPIDQEACSQVSQYFPNATVTDCCVFPGHEFKMITDEMRAANTPFGGLIVRSPDASILDGGQLFWTDLNPCQMRCSLKSPPELNKVDSSHAHYQR